MRSPIWVWRDELWSACRCGLTNKDAEIIGPALQKLGSRTNLNARKVLTAAWKKSSPLHKYFVWTGKNQRTPYGKNYQTAGHILRSVCRTFWVQEKYESAPHESWENYW